MNLDTPLSRLVGIGPTTAKKLERLNLCTVSNLINHYPFRYEDYSNTKNISETKIGEVITTSGQIWSIKNTYTRFRKVLTQAILNDGSGSLELIWFNQPWLIKTLKPGDRVQVSGKINKKGHQVSLTQPQWEKINQVEQSTNQPAIHTGKLIGIYPETYGLTSKWIRTKIYSVLSRVKLLLKDYLPDHIRENLLSLPEALEKIHFPQKFEDINQARDRLSFDELFLIQLATQKKRLEWQEKQIVKPWHIYHQKLADFTRSLPFELTSAQKRVVQEIIKDLSELTPMNRLLQGDVGSGKTVVAAIIAYLADLNHLKTFLMAPTEILAFQHYQTFNNLLSDYGIEVSIYTGSKKEVNIDKAQIVIGTHALLSKKLQLDNIGLVIIDEQQRFGVKQRSLLRNKGSSPHFLTMTATPIPRTVALTLYGDLDLSIIDELPRERKVVQTHFVPNKKRPDAYNFIKQQVNNGFQVYIITPLIEQSETEVSAKAAKVEYERLKTEVFPKLRVGLLHGRLKAKEKDQVITDFKNKRIDILVSTSVVEVGVDVPNATIMLIEGAERFGLAQLHQLRGRVGRGAQQSYTFLFAQEQSSQVIRKLKYLEKINDGLKLSEIDFKLRGSGELYGLKQSGTWNLKIASLNDLKLIEETRLASAKILTESPNLDKYPQLLRKLADLDRQVMPD